MRYLSRLDVARKLDVHPVSVSRLVRTGVLPRPIKLGQRSNSKTLWIESEIDAALQERRNAEVH